MDLEKSELENLPKDIQEKIINYVLSSLVNNADELLTDAKSEIAERNNKIIKRFKFCQTDWISNEIGANECENPFYDNMDFDTYEDFELKWYIDYGFDDFKYLDLFKPSRFNLLNYYLSREYWPCAVYRICDFIKLPDDDDYYTVCMWLLKFHPNLFISGYEKLMMKSENNTIREKLTKLQAKLSDTNDQELVMAMDHLKC